VPALNYIAFDADDTLWHNERLYSMTQERFSQMLSAYQADEIVQQELYKTEMRNLALFGYGIKGFALSMIESAIELTGGQICGEDIQTIIDYAKEMLQAPVQLLDHVEPVISSLAADYNLLLITKGDLFDQEGKIAQSGLANYFAGVEIVSEKSPETYESLLGKYDISPDRFMMVGNSLRSDIFPVLDIGAQAVYIPYHLTWVHETADPEVDKRPGYFELDDISQLPALLSRLGDTTGQ